MDQSGVPTSVSVTRSPRSQGEMEPECFIDIPHPSLWDDAESSVHSFDGDGSNLLGLRLRVLGEACLGPAEEHLEREEVPRVRRDGHDRDDATTESASRGIRHVVADDDRRPPLVGFGTPEGLEIDCDDVTASHQVVPRRPPSRPNRPRRIPPTRPRRTRMPPRARLYEAVAPHDGQLLTENRGLAPARTRPGIARRRPGCSRSVSYRDATSGTTKVARVAGRATRRHSRDEPSKSKFPAWPAIAAPNDPSKSKGRPDREPPAAAPTGVPACTLCALGRTIENGFRRRPRAEWSATWP